MLDRSKIGHEFPAFSVEIEKGRLRMFAKAIAETDPVYSDESAAKAAGYPSLPMPPTFPFVLGREIADPVDVLTLLEVDVANVLHGEQEFSYHRMAFAGDVLTGRKRIVDIHDKKNGALEFIVLETRFTDNEEQLVCESRQNIIVKNKETQQR